MSEPLKGYELKDIYERLPHRFPFLLVDRVLEVVGPAPGSKDFVGCRITAIKNVTNNEPHFTGHFPDNPIMPGVLIIEAMAQSSGLLAGVKPHPTNQKWNFFIAGVDKARFRQTVVPGDQVKFVCEVIKDRGSIFVFACQALVDGKLAAEAEIMAKMF